MSCDRYHVCSGQMTLRVQVLNSWHAHCRRSQHVFSSALRVVSLRKVNVWGNQLRETGQADTFEVQRWS